MKTNIQQNLLDFQLQKTSDTLTSKSGLTIFYEAALALGTVKSIENNLSQPKSNRGLKPSEYIMPLALMFSGGGRTMEDIREIEMDKGLRKPPHLRPQGVNPAASPETWAKSAGRFKVWW